MEELRNKFGSEIQNISDDILEKIYNTSVSIFQSKKSRHGTQFEQKIEKMLYENNVPFKRQVAIDKNGIIIGNGTVVENHSHTIDIVIGEHIKIGKHISDFIVLSCKTTVRERWNQDNWSFEHPPQIYILITKSNDYPQPQKFRESMKRLIVTDKPKIIDKRQYKFNCDDLELIMLLNYKKHHTPLG